MKFDTIIIGGGLAGLVCGLRLQKSGKKTAIVSAGQNAMHFSSGCFNLLSKLPDGTPVTDPIAAIDSLPETHPYRKIGADTVAKYADGAIDFFADNGVKLNGTPDKNGYRLSPTGSLTTTWLGLEDIDLLPTKEEKIGAKALIVNFLGYLDFNTSFIADGLEKKGTACRIEGLKSSCMDVLRKNPSEMRAVNIARVMDSQWKKVTDEVCTLLRDEDVVILPAVFGLKDQSVVSEIKKAIPVKVCFVATMPPSVPGIRSQRLLKESFEKAGGVFLPSDEVKTVTVEEGKVKGIYTSNQITMTADNFVLATGRFFSKGIEATPTRVFEPLFGADVIYSDARTTWYQKDFFAPQEFMEFGVDTDSEFKVKKGGEAISNLYAAGSIIGGFNPLHEGSGAGTAIMTALYVADKIIG
ncbi:MAG: anaerobic glycerol-3-phosphate dehydrogenase subunit B [Bacteroidales bacterium]|nr:anaerobic glycerol-3-phosphate dehydrogenase subunit B [Bacteroidales bacterium]